MKSIHPSLIVVLSALLVLPGLVFIALRLALPGDASNPVVDFQGMKSGELVVKTQSLNPQGLLNGDIVTAIQGRAVDQYIEDLISPQRSEGPANRIEYTVLRGERILKLDVTLTAFPLSRILKESWSIYIYMIYLELVSLFVFILRPRLAAVQLFFVVSNVLFSSGLVFFLSLGVDTLLSHWMVILYVWGAVALFGLMLAGLVHLSLIFPKRHPLLVRHPGWVVWIYLGVWIPMFLYLAVRWAAIVSPVGRLALLVQGSMLMEVVYFPLLLLSTFSSYRTGNLKEKRQLRWLMWALVISLVPYLVFTVLPSILRLPNYLPLPVLGVLWCAVPTSFAIAVLHERLFDIDVIIRRTLIYSALTVTLAAIYFTSIVLLQAFFQVFTGQHQSPLATVLSTLMIAALFNPLRGRIQADIDRRFYRRKYDAEKMLEAFALTVSNEVELEKLTEGLLDLVEETMESQNFSFWIWKS